MLFPEGTSTDGLSVLPFKRSLLMAAANAGCPILPIALKYRIIEEQPFGPENNDVVCWYGKKDFVSHFLRLLTVKSVKAEVSVLLPVSFQTEAEKHAVGDFLHKTITQEYNAQFKNLQGGRGDDGSRSRQESTEDISRGSREISDFAQSP
jgi:1-acyl-sn-glycerol-3-phosphate acyltransferase